MSYEAETARYSTHQNSFEDPGYVKFLNQLAIPMMNYLNSDMKGIDFGCGPGPTLSKIFLQSGIVQENYDPYFFPLATKQNYDFLTATEVIEHFHDPAKGFKEIAALVKSNGMIGLMTSFYQNIDQLYNWYYVADPTHVCFFHHQTLDWLAKEFHWELLNKSERIAIFRVRK
ncbi:MAG: class I SAM-dependent methyltransferase [Bacteriovoracaceae bacterium]|nr:class I SAM-dependent methyltransferase [Bacteriovoracaceae bacterium]